MKPYKTSRLIACYLKEQKNVFLLVILFVVSAILVGWLSNFSVNEALYIFLLWGFFLLCYLGIGFYNYRKKFLALLERSTTLTLGVNELPTPNGLIETSYQTMLNALYQTLSQRLQDMEEKNNDHTAYYTLWTHQIKTPIAGLSLLLQMSDCDEKEEMKSELFRIEQYVEMALTYLRLDHESSDLLIKKCDVEKMVKQSVKKYARLFITKKLSLSMDEAQGSILTDEKWFSFVLEQLLDNALKYTNTGCITISCHKNVVAIKDTGIGIANEDLPRIFEKGYTGYNGRMDQKSTGIGLYLCKLSMQKIGGRIYAESQKGKGSCFYLEFPIQKELYE